jgi:hypothetical protein
MDWEEALLLHSVDGRADAATQYRQKAARAREMAQEATTRRVKARLLNDALLFDRLAKSVDLSE